MKIRDVMTRDVQLARPGDTIQEVATRMARDDFGFVPVADGDRLIGTVTDRDIVGVVSLGDLSTRVKEKYAGETLESISR